MKTNFWRILLIIIPFACIYVMRKGYRYPEFGYLVILLSGIISIIEGIRSRKTHTLLARFLVSIGVISLFFIVLILLTPGGQRGLPSTVVKANLANIRAQAQIAYDAASPASYQSVCSNVEIQKMLQDAKKNSISVKCFGDTDSFVAAAAFKKPTENNTHYCVDSAGASKVITSDQYGTIVSANTLCSQ